ncbi:J domain-containing protein [Burkholderia gladioli]|uniref:J domain-containing protein n=1 Tax=Burkholderia gladioli TaxID=28095 RepID=UPI0019177AF6|nr:J domain-containing protein [Burkholderia gladioli]
MTESPSGAILLVPQDGSAGLSPSQRSFNALTRQVAARRERLRAWETVWPPFQQRYVDEWVPLARELSARETELVRQLDVAAEMKGLSRAERELVSQLIVHFARPLLGADADRELRAILARHGAAAMGQAAGDAGRRGSKSRRRDAAPAEDAAPGHAAAEPPEDESEEAMMLRIQAELDAQEARASADAQARQAQRGERQRASNSKRKAAEAARAAAAQAQPESPAEAEADRTDTEAVPEMAPAQVSRSLRDLYRRLASALHPDREPDADERERKTALMQRLNRAYDKQDLLQLLELERDLGAADADRLAGAGDELLRHYNGILKAQLASLDRELHRVEADFRHGYGIGANAVLSPDTALRTLGDDIAGLRRALAELERDLLALREIGALKDWLAGFVG